MHFYIVSPKKGSFSEPHRSYYSLTLPSGFQFVFYGSAEAPTVSFVFTVISVHLLNTFCWISRRISFYVFIINCALGPAIVDQVGGRGGWMVDFDLVVKEVGVRVWTWSWGREGVMVLIEKLPGRGREVKPVLELAGFWHHLYL